MKFQTILVRKAVDYEQLFNSTKELISAFGTKIGEVEIEKVIEISKDEFDEFKSKLLQDREFIKANKGFTHFLVKEEDTEDEKGIIVVTEGFDYPRYTGLVIIEEKFHKCSRCGKYFIGEPAISRKDNKSEVCNSCGMEEAIEDFRHGDIIMFRKQLQDKADELGVDILVKTKDGFERKIEGR